MDTDDRRKTAVSVKVNAAKPIFLGSSEPAALREWKGSGTTFVFSMLCTGWGKFCTDARSNLLLYLGAK